jgi:hypothetical protein
MPDLSIEHKWTCMTNRDWSVKVAGSKGTTHTVSWNDTDHKNRHNWNYDYSCTCESYKFGKGKDCKHIKEVKAQNLRCGWSQDLDGGKPKKVRRWHFVCPKCGGPLTVDKIAV